nr:phosphoglycerate kinase [Embleya scabrispora]
MERAQTILWNGPVGVWEFANFRNGTETVAQAVAKSRAFSVAMGGDTLAVIDRFNLADKLSYVSTSGGAALEYLEGKRLPGIDVLEARAA